LTRNIPADCAACIEAETILEKIEGFSNMPRAAVLSFAHLVPQLRGTPPASFQIAKTFWEQQERSRY
jgi:hypothetical protein